VPRLRGIGRSLAALLIGLGAGVIVAGAAQVADGPLARLADTTFDLYQRWAPAPAASSVVVVDIDDRSIAALGQWPWPRTRLAALIDRIGAAAPKVLGIDLMLAEPDRTSPTRLGGILAEDGASTADLARVLAPLPDHDTTFAQAMGRLPVILGAALTNEAGAPRAQPRVGFSVVGQDTLAPLPKFAGAIPPLPGLAAAAAGIGFLNVLPDADGRVRRAMLVADAGGVPAPNLSLEMLRVARGATAYELRPDAVRVGGAIFPIGPDGRSWIAYRPPSSIRHLSAVDIMQGRADLSVIGGRLVLLGSSAAGLADEWPTPLGRSLAGVQIEAQILADLDGGHVLSRPSALIGLEVLGTILLSIAVAYGGVYLPAFYAAPLSALTALGWFAVSWLCFTRFSLLLDPILGAESAVLTSSASSLARYLRAELQQRRMRASFSRYLSPALVDELAAHPENLRLGGEIRTITVMFCDIRGFTALAKGLLPAQLTELLNGFFTPMTEIVLAHRGTIDKYIGDCLMAYWNAPLADPHHALHALQAAAAMRDALGAVSARLASEPGLAAHLRQPLRIAIGINTGECCVGNMGSQHRFDYSVLGDAVNVASHLLEAAAAADLDLAIGQDTVAALPLAAAADLAELSINGDTRCFTLPPGTAGHLRDPRLS
jgi:adenylate cyclase